HRCDKSNWESATELRKVRSNRFDRFLRTRASRSAGEHRAGSFEPSCLAMDKGRLPHHLMTMMPKTPRFTPNGSRVVEVLAYPPVKLLDVTGPIQVFASANAYMAESGEPPPYAIRIVAQGGERVEASGGVELAVHPLSPVDAALDTLVIAGG